MRTVLALLFVLVIASGPAFADPGGKGHRGKEHDSASGAQLGTAIITAAEQALIREYFRDRPAMAAGDGLPPGIRKNLARGKRIPPGIAKQMPQDLQGRLSPPHGYGYRIVGADVLLVELATGVIADLLRDVLR